MPDARITYTPNLALTKLPANYHVWAQIMNDNLTMLDAAVSGFVIYDNWRGAWTNSTHYANGDTVVDLTTAVIWTTQVDHTSSSIPTTFNQEQILHPTYWVPANAPANKRGAWMPNTQYNVNDFVLADGVKYAMCLVQHVSGTVFDTDAALGFWSILIDFNSTGAAVPIGSTPPSLPITNQMWWNSDLGQLFIWYNDGNTTQWVPATPLSQPSSGGRILAAAFGCSPSASGTVNSTAIQTALNIGGDIVLPTGIIQLDPVALIPRSNTNIYGTGNGTILTRVGNDGVSYTKPFFDIVDVHDVYLEGITCDFTINTSREYCFHIRASSLGSTRRIYFNKCVFQRAGAYIEKFVDGVRIENCWFLGSAGGTAAQTGIGIGGLAGVNTDGLVRNIIIRGNFFTQYRDEGVDINWNTWDVLIANNIFLDNNLTGINQDIDIGGATTEAANCRNITVTGNVLIHTTGLAHSGITTKQLTSQLTITGNTIFCSTAVAGSAGIQLSATRDTTISGNSIEGFQSGIVAVSSCSEFSITGNTIHNPALDGININTTANNFTVSNNKIVGSVNNRCINIATATDFVVTGNHCSGGLSATGTSDCILVAATASDGTISGNVVSNSIQTGIRVLSPRTAITGNVSHNNGRSGFVLQAQHLTVIGNEAYNNSQILADQYGYNFAAGTDFCVFTNNKAYDTQGTKTQNGALFAACDRMIFNSNILYPFKTVATSGTVNLTNSLNGLTGNIVA